MSGTIAARQAERGTVCVEDAFDACTAQRVAVQPHGLTSEELDPAGAGRRVRCVRCVVRRRLGRRVGHLRCVEPAAAIDTRILPRQVEVELIIASDQP